MCYYRFCLNCMAMALCFDSGCVVIRFFPLTRSKTYLGVISALSIPVADPRLESGLACAWRGRERAVAHLENDMEPSRAHRGPYPDNFRRSNEQVTACRIGMALLSIARYIRSYPCLQT